MFTFSEMLALVESESSFGDYVCYRRPGGSRATSDLVAEVAATVIHSRRSSTEVLDYILLKTQMGNENR